MPSNIVKITQSIFTFLGDLAYATEVAFSRGSISKKMMRLDPGYREWEIRKSLRRLEASGYVKQRNDTIVLTRKGKGRIDHEKIERLSFDPTVHQWDGRWRLIMFDIPEKKRNVRDTFRRKVKEWQCMKLQQSVFVTPYPCDVELRQLIKLLSAQSYVHIITVPSLGKELTQNIKNRYSLNKIRSW